MPPPTGVVSGPLMAHEIVAERRRRSRRAASCRSGPWRPGRRRPRARRCFFFPPYAFSTAASITRTLAAQMSGPVPSPRMNGNHGLVRARVSVAVVEIVIFSPRGRGGVGGGGRHRMRRKQRPARDEMRVKAQSNTVLAGNVQDSSRKIATRRFSRCPPAAVCAMLAGDGPLAA